MHSYFFKLALTYERCESLYQPGNNTVIVLAENGKRIQLPAKNLRSFVQRNGLHGRFRLMITASNKIHSLEKIS